MYGERGQRCWKTKECQKKGIPSPDISYLLGKRKLVQKEVREIEKIPFLTFFAKRRKKQYSSQ